ncbi:ABC transporter substrate-binding protein [Burkholderia multivorans]|uniref:Periplasmic binding protein/LacI transcriptional regulator n=1 Tax=Burkholderia multivorans CGD2 TaxID=513052 RepID=B9BHF1_9BURK|nr:ABC transporter substrate-binding protein [Burkholderia multivorans]EEE09017.1 periplasmic binding protein/LacI transcriptional regulator [Burkholderia multivorans CGD2]EEE14936.1 periplasmic binding protein/LacI transcriptional regulator [Burkholderia multivorans CGD2M]MBU9361285.1 ABC transporter substrate-binding protein [Burkholderia multivorans]
MLRKIAFGLTASILMMGHASAKELDSIGVAVSSLGDPFQIAISKGVEDRAKQINPNVKVTTVASDYDLNKQFSQIDNFIAAKVNLILLAAVDPQAVLPAVKRAEAAGIPVVAVDVYANGAAATVQTNNVKAGEMACQYLSDQLSGKGKVVILNGPAQSSIKDRVKGCLSVLKKGNFEILSDNQNGKATRDGGLAVAQSLMTRFKKIDGMFAVCDQEAIGADLAAKQMNRKEFKIVSVDGSPEVEALLKSDSLIHGSVAQNPYAMAMKATDIGSNIVKSGTMPDTSTILLDPILVTRENVASYKGWGAH